MTLKITPIRKDFPNLKDKIHGKPLAYLDNAATTLKPKQVIDAVSAYYSHYASNIHRAVHALSQKATLQYENTREKVRKFINAKNTAEIIFTSGTTESINLVAQSYVKTFLKANDEIIISEMEHHSNIVPWQIASKETGCTLKIIPVDNNGEIDLERFKELLSSKTKLVSITHTSNVLGTINPVKEIIRIAHGHHVPVLIDAAQAVGHQTIDVQDLDCDFLAFSAHKMYGPTGVGILYGKQNLLEAMAPYKTGGDMIDSVTFEKTTYRELPYKFEAGTPDIASVIGLGAAIDYINRVGLNKISSYEKTLLSYAIKELKNISGLQVVGSPSKKAPIISFVLDGIHPHDLGTILDEQGIAIRTGHLCTQPLLKRFGVLSLSRASLGIYNTPKDIDALVGGIKKAKKVFKC
ncbi:MAG: cysteine desulfurase [Candidatus Omnitrophica bacterium]|nr:cysteine desulfurase [Candidatus Omnitrophota bacterium]